MSSFSIIQDKLEQFIRKYYTNELIRGAILFFSIGLLYLILTLLVEYFLWLDTGGRTVLFWTFVLVEAALFFRFIARPLAKLFNLQQGLDHEAASRIIGAHFPDGFDVYLQDIVGLGCGAAIPTLRSASHFLCAHPSAKVAVVAVEICSAVVQLLLAGAYYNIMNNTEPELLEGSSVYCSGTIRGGDIVEAEPASTVARDELAKPGSTL